MIRCMMDVAHESVQPFVASPSPFRDFSRAAANWPQQLEAHEAGAIERLQGDLGGIRRQMARLLEVLGLQRVIVHAWGGDFSWRFGLDL